MGEKYKIMVIVMSEKQFDLKDNHIRQNGLIMSNEEVVDLLNSQSDAILSYDKYVDDLKKWNEYLRNELKEVCNRDCDKCAEEWCDEIKLLKPTNIEQYEQIQKLQEENEQLKQENQRVYGIIEDGGVLLTEKQLLDVIGEDKVDMFFREQETSNKLQEIKADAKTALLIIKAMQPLPFTISISEAKSLIRLSENVGELLDTEGD